MQTLKLGPLAFLYHRRVSVAGVILALLALVVWTVSLGVGEFPLSPVEVLRVLTGGGEKLERTVVIEWRLARSLVALAVALAAVTVSAVGPVGFVAFVAPQITARLAGTGAPPLAASAAMGALLVVAADLAARGAFGWEVPVGIITSVIGGPFLIWLLFTQSRTYK
ncbi:iron chelate uptake ABC transporter family permease subunit [Corynebacterium diphtheriae bv. mitis]|uniref:iron chelate uptake ABC transporter family permease subunit n=1 Tax=Corynebacterium diphtheriae TaxID=1717 RepID=UPI00202CE8C6|nr:iron chelate uptake ABC transporter family permease subunit [Corynebacterium diphtheriae]MCM0131490.1 iron chelate uptake ABC transporter family permease subunit [Corynebacterium diphtheriae bv. mitis]